jgi:hypothetical protein
MFSETNIVIQGNVHSTYRAFYTFYMKYFQHTTVNSKTIRLLLGQNN